MSGVKRSRNSSGWLADAFEEDIVIETVMNQWVYFGLSLGVFWGITAVFLYTPYPLEWKRPRLCWLNIRNIFIVLNQFFFNFVGAFAGAACLKLFHVRVTQSHLGSIEIILLVFSVLGLSGKLAAIIWELPNAVSALIQSLASKLAKS